MKKPSQPKPIQEPFYFLCYFIITFALTLSDSISTNGIIIIISMKGLSSAFLLIQLYDVVLPICLPRNVVAFWLSWAYVFAQIFFLCLKKTNYYSIVRGLFLLVSAVFWLQGASLLIKNKYIYIGLFSFIFQLDRNRFYDWIAEVLLIN